MLAQASFEFIDSSQLGFEEVERVRIYPFTPYLWQDVTVGTIIRLWNEDSDDNDFLAEAVATGLAPVSAAAVG
jgi:hypothetical protein